jgi:16S rRNA (uracil1498-N3)-methyltransferase
MAERFYVNCGLNPGKVFIEDAEAHHLAVVCRLRPGDEVCLFNGDGREYPARIEFVRRREVALEVIGVENPQRELPFRLDAAAPLPRGDRTQFLVEKLTELGASSFTPLQTERSVIHPRESKLDKLQRYVVEASKQCGRNVLMEVRPMAEWSDFCRTAQPAARRVLGHPQGSRPSLSEQGGDTVFAVGPEGGFTDQEVALALSYGWQALVLGPRILRVETAALALAVLLGEASSG